MCSSDPVHTYPDIFKFATFFSFWIQKFPCSHVACSNEILLSTRIRRYPHEARDSGGKFSLLLLSCLHLVYCSLRDWTRFCTVAHICKHNKQFLKHNTIFFKHNTIFFKHKSIFVKHEPKLSKHNTKLSKHNTKLSKHNTKLSKHNTKLSKHNTKLSKQHKIVEATQNIGGLGTRT